MTNKEECKKNNVPVVTIADSAMALDPKNNKLSVQWAEFGVDSIVLAGKPEISLGRRDKNEASLIIDGKQTILNKPGIGAQISQAVAQGIECGNFDPANALLQNSLPKLPSASPVTRR